MSESHQKKRMDFLKGSVEYVKYFATLSTGSIVISATFLQKLFDDPIWKWLIAVSFAGFMVSIIASVVAYTLIWDAFPEEHEEIGDFKYGTAIAVSIITMWINFLVGICCFALFSVINFMR